MMDAQASWDWSATGDASGSQAHDSEDFARQRTRPDDSRSDEQAQSGGPQRPRPSTNKTRRPRRYGPRTCRICLDTEQPRYPTDAGSTFGISNASSRPTYQSDDPELGRLLSPCKCKGSQKYVHEGCLNAWRTADPTTARNYWQCPTCQFKYQLTRLRGAALLGSWFVRAILSAVILLLSIFLLGIVADPILDLYFDPWGTIADGFTSVVTNLDAQDVPYYYDDDEPDTWFDQFLKGVYSLGIIGFIKSALVVTPWHWWNLRGFLGGGGGRRQGTGRARMENMSIIFVVVGAFTFVMAIWKFVNAMSGRFLRKASDRVLDVAEDEGDDDDDDDDNNGGRGQPAQPGTTG